MPRRKRPRAHDLDPLRAALHGRGAERLSPLLAVPGKPKTTYADRALVELANIEAVARERVEAAAAMTWLDRAYDLRRTAPAALRNKLELSSGVEWALAVNRARGAAADDLRAAILAVALERGLSNREAGHVVELISKEETQRRDHLAIAGTYCPGEKPAERLRAKLITSVRGELESAQLRLAAARAGRDWYALLDDEDREHVIVALESARREKLFRLRALGDRSAVRVLSRVRVRRRA